jgi:ferritin
VAPNFQIKNGLICATITKEVFMDIVLAQALNSQLTYERYSADVYNNLACRLDTANLTGFSAYMHKREAEERTHARKFSDYLADRNVMPVIDGLPKPSSSPEIGSPMVMGKDAFQMALNHEYTVTERIKNLNELALEVDDPATHEFLLWFIHEQVEEERSLEEILTKFALAEGNGAAILALNESLGEG